MNIMTTCPIPGCGGRVHNSEDGLACINGHSGARLLAALEGRQIERPVQATLVVPTLCNNGHRLTSANTVIVGNRQTGTKFWRCRTCLSEASRTNSSSWRAKRR
jgi:hypothetical protein